MDDLLYNSPIKEDNRQYSKEEFAEMKKAERDAVFNLSDSTKIISFCAIWFTKPTYTYP